MGTPLIGHINTKNLVNATRQRSELINEDIISVMVQSIIANFKLGKTLI